MSFAKLRGKISKVLAVPATYLLQFSCCRLSLTVIPISALATFWNFREFHSDRVFNLYVAKYDQSLYCQTLRDGSLWEFTVL